MTDPRHLIVELCRQFYRQGWVSGTGGGISIRDRERVFIAPSGVQKERLRPDDIFILDRAGKVVEAAADTALEVSACAPLFFNAYRLRDAGAVLHTTAPGLSHAGAPGSRGFGAGSPTGAACGSG